MKDMGEHFPEPGILPGNDTSVRSHCCDLGIVGDPGQNRKALVPAEALQRLPGASCLLMTTPLFFPSRETSWQTIWKLWKPKAVGSATRIQKSASMTLSMTLQALPGGQSMMVRPSAFFKASRITGTPEASPGFKIPVTTRTVWLSPVSRIPMGFFFSVMAFLGHTRLQPPQLWQTSEKTIGLSLTYIRAWNRQNWTHSRQPVHAPASNSGSREQTVSVSTWSGRKNRRPLGSSTSQSM